VTPARFKLDENIKIVIKEEEETPSGAEPNQNSGSGSGSGSGQATGTTGASNSAGNDLPSRAHKYFTPDRRNKNLIDPGRINIHNSLIVKQFSNRDYNFNLPDLQAMKLKVRIPSHIG